MLVFVVIAIVELSVLVGLFVLVLEDEGDTVAGHVGVPQEEIHVVDGVFDSSKLIMHKNLRRVSFTHLLNT